MTIVLEMLQDAVEKIGAYAAGEALTAADETRALNVLNNMLDSWSNESLICYAIKEQTLPLVVKQVQYELGPGGDLEDRPIRLIYGPGTAYCTDSNGNRYPVDTYPQDKWNEIWNLTQINATIPAVIFYDPQFPVGLLKVYPTYAGGLGMTLSWDSYLRLTSFATTADTVSLPPGYVQAIQDNLARALWRYFKPDSAPIPADIIEDAAQSKAILKRANVRENIAEFEKVLTQRGTAVWSIYADTWR